MNHKFKNYKLVANVAEHFWNKPGHVTLDFEVSKSMVNSFYSGTLCLDLLYKEKEKPYSLYFKLNKNNSKIIFAFYDTVLWLPKEYSDYLIPKALERIPQPKVLFEVLLKSAHKKMANTLKDHQTKIDELLHTISKLELYLP